MIVVESSHFTEIFIKLAVKNPNLNIRLEMNSGLPNKSRVLSSFWSRADIDMAFVLIAFTFSDSHVYIGAVEVFFFKEFIQFHGIFAPFSNRPIILHTSVYGNIGGIIIYIFPSRPSIEYNMLPFSWNLWSRKTKNQFSKKAPHDALCSMMRLNFLKIF